MLQRRKWMSFPSPKPSLFSEWPLRMKRVGQPLNKAVSWVGQLDLIFPTAFNYPEITWSSVTLKWCGKWRQCLSFQIILISVPTCLSRVSLNCNDRRFTLSYASHTYIPSSAIKHHAGWTSKKKNGMSFIKFEFKSSITKHDPDG